MVHSIVLHGPEGTTDGEVAAENVLGRLAFAANDPDGSYARAVTAKIEAKAEEQFLAAENQTKLVFFLAGQADSGAATAKMSLSSVGTLTLVGAIELGHASDTTLARASAGDLNVEGNLIYRAGGTDVPLADGGTGASSASAARTSLGITYANIGTVDISANTNLAVSTGITLTGDTLTTNDGQIVHNNLSGFVTNEHIDWTGASAGTIHATNYTNTTYSEATTSTQGLMSTAHHDKLDGIETSATADQTNAEIATAVEAASDSNTFTDDDHTKLGGIATSANNYTLPSASTTVVGGVELATTGETTTGSDTARAVTPAGVQAAIDALVDSAPGALNTLNELAEAIGDDESYAATITTALGLKAPLADPTFTGTIVIPSVANLSTAVVANTTTAGAALPKAGGAMTGAITTNSTFDGVAIATRDAILTSTTTTAGAALPKAGGAMTGAITTNSTFDGVDIAVRDGILTSTTTTAGAALPKAGGAMTGAITTNSTFDGRDVAADGVTADAALPKAGGAMTGAITTNSTFDGRDVAEDGTKLNGIEDNATADQTKSDIDGLAITTVGAIDTGSWASTDVAILHGGTGSSTAAGARTNLGLGTAAERAAEDTLTDGANLPDGAAIKAYGDTNWSGGGGSGASLTGSTDNQVVTVTGSDAIAGETRLTFDGDALAVTTIDENKVPVTINGAASQASDLLQLKNSTGNTLLVVDAIGQVGIGDSVDPAAGKLLHISGGTTDGNKIMIFEAGSTGGGDTDNQAILKIVAGTTANAQIQMGHGTASSTLNGGLKYKSNDTIVLRANNADVLEIDSSKVVNFKIGEHADAMGTLAGAVNGSFQNIYLEVKVGGSQYYLRLYEEGGM
jgi:hypothetical protein